MSSSTNMQTRLRSVDIRKVTRRSNKRQNTRRHQDKCRFWRKTPPAISFRRGVSVSIRIGIGVRVGAGTGAGTGIGIGFDIGFDFGDSVCLLDATGGAATARSRAHHHE